MKRCAECDRTKPVSEFYRNRAKKDGYTDQCAECARTRNGAWRQANRSYIRKRVRENREALREYTLTERDAARFWAKVDVRSPDECWPWVGATAGVGYGQMWVGGRNQRANRLAWELDNGVSVPAGLFVCHMCNNPPCCNPRHLYVDAQSGNMTYASQRGRMAIGLQNGNAKLNPLTVRRIRRLREQGLTLKQIADQVGTDFSNVGRILRGETWTHVA